MSKNNKDKSLRKKTGNKIRNFRQKHPIKSWILIGSMAVVAGNCFLPLLEKRDAKVYFKNHPEQKEVTVTKTPEIIRREAEMREQSNELTQAVDKHKAKAEANLQSFISDSIPDMQKRNDPRMVYYQDALAEMTKANPNPDSIKAKIREGHMHRNHDKILKRKGLAPKYGNK